MEVRSDKIPFRTAAFLVVASAALYGLYDYLFSGIEWTPLRIPMELVEGREHAGDFIALWDVVYEVHLDTERSLDRQQQNCLLGIETVAPERCAGISPGLGLSWQVQADGEVIASGTAEGTRAGSRGPRLGKILGAFRAVRGQSYQIAATVGRSSPELQQSNPRLQVTVAPRERKWTYVWSGLLIMIATSLLLLAIVLSVLLLRRRAR
jgi:hypothetical protein